ncbi:MAG: hypothetical protein DYH08_12930 [Actinobacteria bacterium ATB1]|nr:hypothetical protein [Actinobacteria bacterium ATB1]
MTEATGPRTVSGRVGHAPSRPLATIRPRLLRLRSAARVLVFPLVAFAVWRSAWALTAWAIAGDPVDLVTAWDGEWYLRILHNGYEFIPDSAQPTAFFPLLPWVTRPVVWLVRSELVAILVVTNLAAAGALCAVYVTLREWRGERTARSGLVLLLVWPASYILWSYYSEALFLAASAAALWAFRRHVHWLVVVGAALATMSRIPGVLLVALLVALRIREMRRLEPVALLYAAGVLALVPVLAAQQIQAGDAFAFLGAGRPWGRRPALPWVIFVDAFRKVTGDHGLPARLEALFDMASVALGVTASAWLLRRSGRERGSWPLEAGLWSAVMIGFPLFSSSHLSMSRYLLSAWPVFGATGEWLGARSRASRAAVHIVCVSGCVAALTAVATGWFVA